MLASRGVPLRSVGPSFVRFILAAGRYGCLDPAQGAQVARRHAVDRFPIRITRERLAGSNAELVGLAVAAVTRHGRRVATPAQARPTLGLPA
ncbi:hypothetical protein Y590_06035 [Methylobacterium sp. AMS5]|nr:hypothetical protein Y590_06035 [Methylobacterium sp. AMS5]